MHYATWRPLRGVVLPAVILGVVCAPAWAEERPAASDLILNAERVLVLGDSITYSGRYVAVVEAALRASGKWPTDSVGPLILNLGLSSEGVTGLSEPYHPFPRPNVHSRLKRALAEYQPDLVVACYGMNDGIYHPFSEERFDAYKKGVNQLIADVHEANAQLILMTPPPFDPVPVRDKLVGADAKEHGYKGVYENYDDEVLARYAEWIRDQAPRVQVVIPLHGPINEALRKRREREPDFTTSGDGVHPNADGHAFIAQQILDRDEAPEFAGPFRGQLLKLVEQRQRLLRDAWHTHVGHERPGVKAGLPLDEAKARAAEIEDQIDALVAKNLNDR